MTWVLFIDVYLYWHPAINVFEVKRPLIFTERQSVIGLKAVQLLFVIHHKYLQQTLNIIRCQNVGLGK